LPRLFVFFIVCLTLAGWPAVLCADEAPHARAYLDRLDARLERVGAEMSTITRAAELAADALAQGRVFGAQGEPGLLYELSNRAGAMMGYDGRPGEPGDVILCVFGVGRPGGWGMEGVVTGQVIGAEQLKQAGSIVIGVGSERQMRALGLMDRADKTCDVWLENHADPGNEAQGVPMDTVLNAAVAWAFECELFAALTRLDKVPVVRQSFEIDTRHKRWLRYGSQRFHHDRWLDPITPGSLGRTYIVELQGVLLDIGTASWRRLSRTANRANDTCAAGGTVWLRAGGRYLPYHVGGQLGSDPGVFTPLTHDGSDPDLPVPGKNDYVIAVGLNETAGSWEWGEPELLRKAGRGVAWIVNGYNTQPADLYRRETLIDLWGPVGDTVVKVKDYDTHLGPVSGVTAEAVTWMIAAEVVGKMREAFSADYADDTDSE
jgi:hypothetical protein